MVDISLILTTHGHSKDARRVVDEMIKASNSVPNECEVIVVTHDNDPKNVPDGDDFIHLIQPKMGCASSVWYGAMHCNGKWDVYLCDDHEYPDSDWLKKFIAHRDSNPTVKLFGIRDGKMNQICPSIGVFSVEWFRDNYPEPVYEHYAWEDHNLLLAKLSGSTYSNREGGRVGNGWMYMDDVVIIQSLDDRVNQDRRARDTEIWQVNKKELEKKLIEKFGKI